MKILFFASDYQIGLSSLLTDQLIALKHNNIDVYPIAGEKSQEYELSERIEYHGITLHRIEGLDTHKRFFKLCYLLKKIIASHNIQFIHVQNNWQLALMAYTKYILLQNKEIKIIYTLHGFRHNSPIKAFFARLIIGTVLFLFADKIICMCNYLKKKFDLLSYKIAIIPLGIADSFFEEELPPMPTNGLQMIFPAQFRKGKNQDIIIKAFAKHLHDTNDIDSKLILPGSGPLLDKMKQLVYYYQIENRVVFPGLCSKKEIKDWYLKSNVGIIASNSETFGQSIVETVVLGRCLLSTHVGIADDILINGRNGFFFSSEEELVKIFSLLLAHPEKIKETGEYNFNQKSIFKWSEINKKYANLLNIMTIPKNSTFSTIL